MKNHASGDGLSIKQVVPYDNLSAACEPVARADRFRILKRAAVKSKFNIAFLKKFPEY
jgi:hypothetical protein